MVSSRELHSGSGVAGMTSGGRVVAGPLIIVAAGTTLMVSAAVAATVVAARVMVSAVTIVGARAMASMVSGAISGAWIHNIVIAGGIPVWPIRARLDLLPRQAEMEKSGIAQGVSLMPVVVWHKDLLADWDEPPFGDHKVKDPSWHAPIVGHVLIHGYWDRLGGGGSQILVRSIHSYSGAPRFGDHLESAENVLGGEQPGGQDQAGDQEKSQFHVFLLGELMLLQLILPCL